MQASLIWAHLAPWMPNSAMIRGRQAWQQMQKQSAEKSGLFRPQCLVVPTACHQSCSEMAVSSRWEMMAAEMDEPMGILSSDLIATSFLTMRSEQLWDGSWTLHWKSLELRVMLIGSTKHYYEAQTLTLGGNHPVVGIAACRRQLVLISKKVTMKNCLETPARRSRSLLMPRAAHASLAAVMHNSPGRLHLRMLLFSRAPVLTVTSTLWIQ